MRNDKDGKEKFKAPKKPVCVGCLEELKPPTVKQDWCDGCWPASPRPR